MLPALFVDPLATLASAAISSGSAQPTIKQEPGLVAANGIKQEVQVISLIFSTMKINLNGIVDVCHYSPLKLMGMFVCNT